MIFPYFSLADGFDSTLNLVSDSPKPLSFILAIHNLAGQAQLSSSMTIQPGAKMPIDMRSLLISLGADVTGTFSQGSVSVLFEGTIMPLVGQMTIENPARHWVQEAEMVENDPGRSDIPSVLSGQWWGLAGGRDATIMVTNASANTVTADVFLAFQGKEHKLDPLVFDANATRMLSVASMLGALNVSVAQAPQGSIAIIQRGTNPSLVAQGNVTDPVTGFSTTLEFPDPARQLASAVHASGIPIGTPTPGSPFAGDGTFTPHVIASNVSNAAQSVTVTVEYPEGKKLMAVGKKEFDGESGTGVGQMTLATLQVPADSTEDFSLAAEMGQLPLPLPYASVRIQFSGAPGSLIAQVSSVDESQDLVVDARTMNEGDGWAGSGANPWHIDSQTQSILFLTDESDKPARIGFSVTVGAVTYYLTQLKLNPHETRAINIQKLRDAQKADFKKNKIPAGATDGGVRWNRIDHVAVTGRVVVISKQSGIASGYDCCTCCCPLSYSGLSIYPSSWWVITGQTTGLTAYGNYYDDCNGGYEPYDDSFDASWTSGNTSVATMGGNYPSDCHAVGEGTAAITAVYSDYGNDHLCPDCTARLVTFHAYGYAYVDSLVFTVTSGGAPNDSQGVVAKQAFNLRIQTKTPSGVVPDTGFNSQNVTFTLVNKNTSVGEAGPSSVNFSSGTANSSVTIVQASGLTNSTRQIVVSASATGTVFFPYVYMNVFATDEGNAGQPTACPGYVMPSNAQMVALPYGQSLCGQQVLVANGAAHQQVPVEDVGPWCPNSTPIPSNPCVCSPDNYWQGTAIPWAATHSCSSNGAGIDLGDGTYATVRGGTNGPVDWKFP